MEEFNFEEGQDSLDDLFSTGKDVDSYDQWMRNVQLMTPWLLPEPEPERPRLPLHRRVQKAIAAFVIRLGQRMYSGECQCCTGDKVNATEVICSYCAHEH